MTSNTSLDRRTFVAGAAVGLGTLAAAGSALAAEKGSVSAGADMASDAFETTVAWDAEYDVVVIVMWRGRTGPGFDPEKLPR